MHDQLKEILKLLNENKTYAKHADVKTLFDALASSLREYSSESEVKRKSATEALTSSLAAAEKRLAAALATSTDQVSRETAAAVSVLRKDIAALKKELAALPVPLTGSDVTEMLEAFRASIVFPELPQPLSSEDIRDRLELLLDDERLDAAYIKNLPEATEKIVERYHGNSALYTLADVDMAGIVPGQSIIYDGVKWLPYTPAGSGGTPVWGEDLTDQGPGTDFTLDHTPIAGSVRLFRGGAYQSASQGDYSITGADITLAISLADGEVLVADYSFT